MSRERRNVDPLLTQLVRLSRLLHRLKSSGPSGPADRSANILLMVVERLGPMRVADLANTCHVDASTVSRQAADLVQAGLLRREADPQDGRASLMALTSAGRQQVKVLTKRRREFFQRVVADWPSEELDRFLDQLTHFIDDIERHVDAVDPQLSKVQA